MLLHSPSSFLLMGENTDKKRVIDVTGIELAPGEPDVCLGNGEQGFECCCDECEYYLSCFSEFDLKNVKASAEEIVFREVMLV